MSPGIKKKLNLRL